MQLTVSQNEPAKVYLSGWAPEKIKEAKRFLTFRDRRAYYDLQRHKRSEGWYVEKHGQEQFDLETERLEAALNRCVLFEDEFGQHWTYTGLIERLRTRFDCMMPVHSLQVYPQTSPIPWKKPLLGEDRPFQSQSFASLLAEKHGSVEIATGLGKTRIILRLIRQLGLQTIVMAPLESIARNIYRQLVDFLGEKYVGYYGGGKHKFNKLVTVGLHLSLCKIEPGSKAWQSLHTAQCVIVDESHMTPAASLEKVCLGLAARASYRFFFSATQIRSDGSKLVLSGVNGPIVHTKTFEEGVQDGYLSAPHFRMVKIHDNRSFRSPDPNENTRFYLYYSPQVLAKAAQIANAAVTRAGHQVLVLVQEIEQFVRLESYLRVPAQFAWSENPKAAAKLPKQYRRSDPEALVDAFNRKEFPLLVGTSCIATGVDILHPRTGIYLMGQSSEVKTKQALGRMTRRPAGKDDFYWFDFDVTTEDDCKADDPDSNSTTHRHAMARLQMYEDLYPKDVKVV